MSIRFQGGLFIAALLVQSESLASAQETSLVGRVFSRLSPQCSLKDDSLCPGVKNVSVFLFNTGKPPTCVCETKCDQIAAALTSVTKDNGGFEFSNLTRGRRVHLAFCKVKYSPRREALAFKLAGGPNRVTVPLIEVPENDAEASVAADAMIARATQGGGEYADEWRLVRSVHMPLEAQARIARALAQKVDRSKFASANDFWTFAALDPSAIANLRTKVATVSHTSAPVGEHQARALLEHGLPRFVLEEVFMEESRRNQDDARADWSRLSAQLDGVALEDRAARAAAEARAMERQMAAEAAARLATDREAAQALKKKAAMQRNEPAAEEAAAPPGDE